MKTISLSIFLMTCLGALAQEKTVNNPPVYTEFVFGNKGIGNQTIISKKLKTVPRLGFFAITNFGTEWKTQSVHDYMLQGNLTFAIIKGLDLTAGYQFVEPTGIRPSLGIIYTLANRDWLLVFAPKWYIDECANVEGFAITEYKPRLSDKWRIYTRVQMDYVFTANEQTHDRSYLWLRGGVSWQEFNFGLAANLDYYGPTKNFQHNIGAFIGVNLF